MLKKSMVAGLVIAIVLTVLLAGPILANKGQQPATGERPGWGYGDVNHIHTGPPGLSD